jgi:hypothetical protein
MTNIPEKVTHTEGQCLIRGANSGESGGVWSHTRATSRRPRAGQGNFHPPNSAVFCLELLYQLKCSFYGGYFDVFKNDGKV